MTRQDAFKQLMLGVNADFFDYQRLALLLEDQFAAALRHDATGLSSIGERITALAEVLEHRRVQRVNAVTALLPGRKAISMTALIATFSGKPREALDASWRGLEAKVAECKALNARNGRLMASQFEVMQRVLHGESDMYAPV